MTPRTSSNSLPNRQRRWLTVLWLSAFAVAGCGPEREQTASEKSAEQLTREIEAVAELKPPVKEGDLPISLVPLKRSDLAQLSHGPIACYLFRGEKIYLATTGADAILRINGRLTHVLAGGPVGPTGGFFTARDTRVSIGRTGKYAGRAADYVPGWLADVAVRAGPEAMAQHATGSWTCRRQARA
jgi:hypothetical protein